MYRVTINQRPDVMAYRRATDALRRLEQLRKLAGSNSGINYRIKIDKSKGQNQ